MAGAWIKRKKIIEKEDAKMITKAQEGKPASLCGNSKPSAKATLVGDHREIMPNASPKSSIPAMPKVAAPASEQHRPALRELVKQKIRELEFKVAIELFASVARLKNPKAKAALDKEWENFKNKGVWDEKRVRECRDAVAEARKTVHLGRIFKACYEKGSELPESDPRRKFKGRTAFL